MRKSLLALLLLLPMLGYITGCSDSSHKGALYKTAQVRILHASPDGPDLDIVVNDDVEWANLAYQEGSGYENLPPDEVDVEVNVSGTSQTLVDESFFVEKRTPYSLIVLGVAANMELLLLEDDDTEPNDGYGRLRIVDASPSQPAIDVYITEPDVPMEFAVPTLQDFEFQEFSSFLELEEGEYQIRITLSGEMEPIYDSGTVTLEEGSISTVAILDAASGGSPLTLVALTDDSDEPVVEVPDARCTLRLIHASPDASFVDVLLDDTEVISTVQFRSASDYEVVKSGTRNIKVEEGSSGLTLIDGTITLEGGKNYTFLLMNFEAAIEAMLLEDDTTPPAANKAKVRFIHASPDPDLDPPNVDFLVDGTVKVSDVPFKGVSSYIEFWQGDHDFEVYEAGTSVVLIGGPFSTPEHLEDGKAYTFMVVDELEDIRSLLVTDD
ncbi:MAG: DUF4397 domain-containing protein [Thermodesulfobacteriota bacterium]|nr:DUF4397 domain-containing protein [Thermodesulfobacteriota bacterium]